jgi:YVTN family beta-propeller protein
MKGNSGRKLMAMILFLALPAALLATVSVRSATADTVVSTVAVGSGPCAVAVNPVTNKIYIVNTNVDFTNSNNDINNGGHTGSVTVIDGADNSNATVDAGILPCAIAVNPVTNKIYVANRDSNTVTVIDAATNQSATVAVGLNPITLAVNPATNKIYVVNNSDDGDTVTVIDAATNHVVDTVCPSAGDDPCDGIAEERRQGRVGQDTGKREPRDTGLRIVPAETDEKVKPRIISEVMDFPYMSERRLNALRAQVERSWPAPLFFETTACMY